MHTAQLSLAFLSALRAADGPGAEAVLRRALAVEDDHAAALTRVVQPAMEQIGVHWEHGVMSIADEHLATAICKRALAAVYPELIARATDNGVRVVLAGVGGQLHSLGLRLVSDVLEGLGYEAVYLGADTPPGAIADAVRRHAPRLVALSLTLPEDLGELEDAVDAVRVTDPAVSVLIGGRGVPEALHDYPGYVPDAERVGAVARALLAREPIIPTFDAVTRVTPLRDRATSGSESELATAAEDLATVARQQARRAREYRALAYTDPVTGLPNRRAWDEQFEDAALEPDLAVLVLDLDGFKVYNDRAGHLAGDTVLTRVGQVLRSVLRAEDFVARLGGDEFGVLLPETDTATAMTIARRACDAIDQALQAGVTASVGVAPYALSPRATTLSADQALYRAKAGGGNRAELAA